MPLSKSGINVETHPALPLNRSAALRCGAFEHNKFEPHRSAALHSRFRGSKREHFRRILSLNYKVGQASCLPNERVSASIAAAAPPQAGKMPALPSPS